MGVNRKLSSEVHDFNHPPPPLQKKTRFFAHNVAQGKKEQMSLLHAESNKQILFVNFRYFRPNFIVGTSETAHDIKSRWYGALPAPTTADCWRQWHMPNFVLINVMCVVLRNLLAFGITWRTRKICWLRNIVARFTCIPWQQRSRAPWGVPLLLAQKLSASLFLKQRKHCVIGDN